jgi:chromosome partitioning protein
MSVIAVVNRKGGSGKSTLATHIAAYCALRGAAVAIADIDRQQSTRAWLRQRKAQLAGEATRITAWNVDPRSFVRPPVGIDHVVIDTPGGLTGLDLARVVMYADALLVPIGASIFDRESAAACLAELRTLPRVASGRCRVGAIGMRVEAHSDSAEALLGWSREQTLQILAVLPQSSAYVRCIDKGLTLFDLPLEEIEADLVHWKPLLQWLRPLVRPAADWNENPRWKGIKRGYTADDVVRLRGSVQVEHTLAKRGAEKLWKLDQRGAVRQLARRADRQPGDAAGQGRPEGDLPVRLAGRRRRQPGRRDVSRPVAVPGQLGADGGRRINNTLTRADQIQWMEGKNPGDDGYIDYFAPIVADAEAGFGGVLNAFELMKAMIEAGAAGVHFEDQLAS